MNRKQRVVIATLAFASLLATAMATAASFAHAEGAPLPWIDHGDIPLPPWAQSIAAKEGDLIVRQAPARSSVRRGVSAVGVRLPLFGAKRGEGCAGRWLLVGPLAWVCSDHVTLLPEPSFAPPISLNEWGLEHSYFFVNQEETSSYARADGMFEDAPQRDLEMGWGLAITEQVTVDGERWGKTPKGEWLTMRSLAAARPSRFRGEEVHGELDFGWVIADRAPIFSAPKASKPASYRTRFERVAIAERKDKYARIADNEWITLRDIAVPNNAPPPSELLAGERWIDVDLASQTLVAYEGEKPLYATLVSTGRGAQGTDSATPKGTHRIWVKLRTTNMDNTERDDLEQHYSMEDVPYVQFFDKAVALHGVYWHNQFGRVKSHGCINLAPIDSKWLFHFTSPKLPANYHAVLPTPFELGTLVRVR